MSAYMLTGKEFSALLAGLGADNFWGYALDKPEAAEIPEIFLALTKKGLALANTRGFALEEELRLLLLCCARFERALAVEGRHRAMGYQREGKCCIVRPNAHIPDAYRLSPAMDLVNCWLEEGLLPEDRPRKLAPWQPYAPSENTEAALRFQTARAGDPLSVLYDTGDYVLCKEEGGELLSRPYTIAAWRDGMRELLEGKP